MRKPGEPLSTPGYLSPEWSDWDEFDAAGGVGRADNVSLPSDYRETRNLPANVRTLYRNAELQQQERDASVEQYNLPTLEVNRASPFDDAAIPAQPVPLVVTIDPATQQPVIAHQTLSPVVTTQTATTATTTATTTQTATTATINGLIAKAKANPLLIGGGALALLLLLTSGDGSRRK